MTKYFCKKFCTLVYFLYFCSQKVKKTILIWAFLCGCLALSGQVRVRSFSEQIRTLRASRAYLVLDGESIDGSESDNTMEISFDEMSHDVHMYTYMVRHMTANWSSESSLTSGEYLRGFTTQDIVDYAHSLNTSREYTHYRFSFPNSDMVLLRSGNYRLTVYEDGDPDKRVAEVDICVVEPLTKIEATVRSNTDIEFNGRYQQVDVEVKPTAIEVRDPGELRVLVRQNNRTDNQVWLTQPTFFDARTLRYINRKELIFEGGNEYHHFDAFSLYFAGVGIDRMVYELGDYHALLLPNEVHQGIYTHEYDSDGRFVVNAERTSDVDTEAEYVWVHWMVPVQQPWFDGALYIGGELFQNECSLRNRMEYDNHNRCYHLTSLVKQGGYDYQFWFVGKGTQNKTTTQRVDGSYWQTENEYTVLVYWRPFGARYDRLVGFISRRSE